MQDELQYAVYSPNSLIGIFNNALRLPVTINLLYIKGRYTFGTGRAYSNNYYDFLYSESDTTAIGIKIPGLLRSTILNNEIYTLKGYVEKSVKNSSIQLVFVVDEIIGKQEKKISEEDLQRYELIQQKLKKGSKDLEALIRNKKLRNEEIRIANVYGHSAIVQHDFVQGLDISSPEFAIDDYKCNITSATSILQQLSELKNQNYDIIALVRGGGDRQSFDVFNDVLLAKEFIDMSAIAITALGHTVDESLLDKLADKCFHVPYDYGDGLHKIVEKLKEEKSNSRAILIEEVKRDITKQFDEQVKTLQVQLTKKNVEFVEAQKTFKESIEEQAKTFNEQLKVRNEEVEKLKKEISETYGKQVTTLSQQLAKKNDEFQKLQENIAKDLENIHKNYQIQQANRLKEMEDYKNEIAFLHEKNIMSAVNEKTAVLSAAAKSLETENKELRKLNNSQNNKIFLLIAFLLGALLSYFLFVLFNK